VRAITTDYVDRLPAGAEKSDAWHFAQAVLGNPVSEPAASECDAGESELLEFVRAITTIHEWDPAQHPRGGNPRNPGEFSKKPGSGSKAKSPAKASGGASAPKRIPHLPSPDRGEWVGAVGDSIFRLNEPLDLETGRVKEIKFKKGIPVLEPHALPGKTATIILTGHHGTDLSNAKKAWTALNKGKPIPGGATFHHDLLHVVEETITIQGKDGKQTEIKVLVGKVQRIATKVNQIVFHEGSASVARKFYKGLGIDVAKVAAHAQIEAALGSKSKLVSEAMKKIKPGIVPKSLRLLVGRPVLKIIPIVGTGLAVIQFSDNVEAHGIGGAVVRTIPVLGDLISAHDLGSDLAKEIMDDANASLKATEKAVNDPIAEAWDEASKQTIEAFQELAPKIQVTNEYGHVEPLDIADALQDYRNKMQQANHLRKTITGFDFDAAAAGYKRELKERLTNACQKDAPKKRGPTM